jgi:hydrogenase-4 membrane subunit HyfE
MKNGLLLVPWIITQYVFSATGFHTEKSNQEKENYMDQLHMQALCILYVALATLLTMPVSNALHGGGPQSTVHRPLHIGFY